MKLKIFYCLLIAIQTLFTGCATGALKGVSPEGTLVYLGELPIETSEAFEKFSVSPKREIDKIHYLFKRFSSAKDFVFYRDGRQYTWDEAYRGGMWLMRNKYEKGIDARTFIRKHIRLSDQTGTPHYVKLPDGSFHEGYYILINELDLLEKTLSTQ